MMRPFKPGDRLEDHAVPIGEVMQQLQTQLAEYRALKEQMADGAARIPGDSAANTLLFPSLWTTPRAPTASPPPPPRPSYISPVIHLAPSIINAATIDLACCFILYLRSNFAV